MKKASTIYSANCPYDPRLVHYATSTHYNCEGVCADDRCATVLSTDGRMERITLFKKGEPFLTKYVDEDIGDVVRWIAFGSVPAPDGYTLAEATTRAEASEELREQANMRAAVAEVRAEALEVTLRESALGFDRTIRDLLCRAEAAEKALLGAQHDRNEALIDTQHVKDRVRHLAVSMDLPNDSFDEAVTSIATAVQQHAPWSGKPCPGVVEANALADRLRDEYKTLYKDRDTFRNTLVKIRDGHVVSDEVYAALKAAVGAPEES